VNCEIVVILATQFVVTIVTRIEMGGKPWPKLVVLHKAERLGTWRALKFQSDEFKW
jgi:hypothetical protein